MRFDITAAVEQDHPGIQDLLWRIAVLAKNADPDIKLMGLYVRAIKDTSDINWSGWALPEEESYLYRKKLVHPAGRIDLRIGTGVSDVGITRLFAHELRHIGQFHRGRQVHGYLTTDHLPDEEVEPDCYAFEDEILKMNNRTPCKGRSDEEY